MPTQCRPQSAAVKADRHRLGLAGLLLASACALALPGTAAAGNGAVKIGVITDQSGPFADIVGKGTILAAQMAIDEAGGMALGKPIELVTADPQNKTEVGLSLAQEWVNTQDVDLLADLPSSSVALAVQDVLRNGQNGILMLAAPNAAAITGASCSPYGFMWATDSYASANVAARGVIAEGGDTWFFIQVDWAAGDSAAESLKGVIESAGGQVVGHVKHSVGATDLSSFILQAQGSGAKTIALINSGNDFLNSVRQAREFGVVQGGQRLHAALTLYVTDPHALGLDVAQGLTGVSGFEWNQSAEAEAWSRKFFEKHGKMPTAAQIGQYSQVRHYLKAVEAAGTDDRDAVAAKIRELPVDDVFVKNGSVRKDGRMMHDIKLIQVKTPEESTDPWDVFKVVRTLPGEEAFRPLEAGGCPLALAQ